MNGGIGLREGGETIVPVFCQRYNEPLGCERTSCVNNLYLNRDSIY